MSVPHAGDPGALVQLAADLHEAGWDGFFLWDHLQFVAALELELHDPWLLLGAIAGRTRRLRLGTAVTPSATAAASHVLLSTWMERRG